MGARTDPTIGFGLVETRANPDTLAAKGVGATDSAYTEAGPIPGHPVPADTASRWRPMIRRAQSADLTLLTLRGGFPGRNGTTGAAYRLASESAQADYRSWDEPNLVTDWSAPDDAWGASQTWDDVTACVIPSSHKIIVVARSSTDAQTWEYDPRTEAWTNLYDWTSNPGLASPIALAYDEETERLLLWAGDGGTGDRATIGFQSVDGGTTWTIYTRGQYDTTVDSAGGRMVVATAVGADWLAITPIGAGNLWQMASSDRGVTWEEVPVSLGLTSDHFPIRTSSGFVVLYSRDADGYLCSRLLGSARSPFADAAETLIWSNDTRNIVGCRDYDGALYVYARASSGVISVHRSLDDGATWAMYGGTGGSLEYALSSPNALPDWRACLPAAGAIHNVGLTQAVTQWHLARFGGWSNVEQASRGTIGSLHGGLARFGSGGGVDYIALEFPDTYLQWTRSGAAGTRTMSGTKPGFQFACTQLQVEQYTSAAFTGDWCCGAARFSVSAATPALNAAAGPVFDSGLSFQPVIDDGVSRYRAYIEVGRDGLAVWDGATRRASVAISCQVPTHIRYYMRKGGITVWYRQLGTTKWTRVANDVVLTAGATVASTTVLLWGHAAAAIAGTSTLYVQYVYHSTESSFRHELDTLQSSDNAYTSGVLGLAYGRRVPGRGDAYPVPDATTSSEDVGYLTAVGGPTKVAETVSLPAGHTYDLDHIYPDGSPSPRVAWRSTGSTLTHITWDQGANGQIWGGGAMGLVVLRAQPRTFVLEIDDGAGGWTTLGTLDKGWSSINYTLSGRSMIPRAGTATIDRYIHEGELVGGYVVCSTAGVSVARTIIRNSGGYWSTSSTLQIVRIGLDPDEIDGTETAAGTGEVVHHSGVLVAYRSADLARRRMRIRIDASQITPGGWYGAGIAAPLRIAGVGNAPSWGWTRRTDFSRSTRRAADGSLLVRETGPPRRIWAQSWPDGVQLKTMRLLASDAGRIGVASSAIIGTQDDAWTSPVAWIEHALRSGEVPAVVIPQLPTTTSTITDPSMYMYGRLESDGVGVTSFAGRPGVDEVLRVDSISFEEIR